MISLTIFNNIYDNSIDKKLDLKSWKAFTTMLRKLSEISVASKKDANLISPAIYDPSSDKRRNANVIAWAGWAALDVDDHDFEGNIEDSIKEKFGKYTFVCYSTASSRVEKPKFRIVFQTKNTVMVDQIRPFWFALNTEFDSIGDKQCKDLSRMYYSPGNYDNAYNFFFTNDAVPIDHYELIDKHPYTEKKSKNFIDRLPKNLQKEIVSYRKEQMKNRDRFSWSSYADCPFVNKKLIKDYKSIAHIDNSGRYAMIYKIMVSIATLAIKNEYPITANEIINLVRQLDADTSNRYKKRRIEPEANRAIEFAYKNA